jgi:8-oxo-dGTP diphosphatase
MTDEGGRLPGRRPQYFHDSAGAVVLVDGKCLVIRRADRDEWVLPKGHMGRDEPPEDAAVREVKEETGLEIAVVAFLGATRYSFGPEREHRKRVEWFLADVVGGTLHLEKIFSEALFVDAERANAILSHAADREIVARAFAAATRPP